MSNDDIVRPAAILNAHLRVIDQTIIRTALTPKEQIAVAALATALAMRRFLETAQAHGSPLNRGQRHQLIKAAVRDFEEKLYEHGGTGVGRDDDPPHPAPEDGE